MHLQITVSLSLPATALYLWGPLQGRNVGRPSPAAPAPLRGGSCLYDTSRWCAMQPWQSPQDRSSLRSRGAMPTKPNLSPRGQNTPPSSFQVPCARPPSRQREGPRQIDGPSRGLAHAAHRPEPLPAAVPPSGQTAPQPVRARPHPVQAFHRQLNPSRHDPLRDNRLHLRRWSRFIRRRRQHPHATVPSSACWNPVSRSCLRHRSSKSFATIFHR